MFELLMVCGPEYETGWKGCSRQHISTKKIKFGNSGRVCGGWNAIVAIERDIFSLPLPRLLRRSRRHDLLRFPRGFARAKSPSIFSCASELIESKRLRCEPGAVVMRAQLPEHKRSVKGGFSIWQLASDWTSKGQSPTFSDPPGELKGHWRSSVEL